MRIRLLLITGLLIGCGGKGNANNSSQNPSPQNTTGTPVARISQTSVTFSSQFANIRSTAQSIALPDTGTGNLAISSIAVSGDFAESDNCGKGIGAGAGCAIQVTFTPTAAGTRTGQLVIQDNSDNSPQVASLSGTGVTTAVGTITATGPNGTTSSTSFTLSSK